MSAIKLNLGDTRLIIAEAKRRGVIRNQLAYILATTFLETANTMKPVREYGGEKYLKSKKYYPFVGMGYVQITWDYNYKKAGAKLGVDFISNPKLLLQPKYAAPILVIGMIEGWFTGKKLSDFITLSKSDFRNARKIINPKDYKTYDQVAGYAKEYDALLKAEGYGEDSAPVPTPAPVAPIPAPVEPPLAPSPPTPEPAKSRSLWAMLLGLFARLFKRT